jgi:hypothetical protein
MEEKFIYKAYKNLKVKFDIESDSFDEVKKYCDGHKNHDLRVNLLYLIYLRCVEIKKMCNDFEYNEVSMNFDKSEFDEMKKNVHIIMDDNIEKVWKVIECKIKPCDLGNSYVEKKIKKLFTDKLEKYSVRRKKEKKSCDKTNVIKRKTTNIPIVFLPLFNETNIQLSSFYNKKAITTNEFIIEMNGFIVNYTNPLAVSLTKGSSTIANILPTDYQIYLAPVLFFVGGNVMLFTVLYDTVGLVTYSNFYLLQYSSGNVSATLLLLQDTDPSPAQNVILVNITTVLDIYTGNFYIFTKPESGPGGYQYEVQNISNNTTVQYGSVPNYLWINSVYAGNVLNVSAVI